MTRSNGRQLMLAAVLALETQGPMALQVGGDWI